MCSRPRCRRPRTDAVAREGFAYRAGGFFVVADVGAPRTRDARRGARPGVRRVKAKRAFSPASYGHKKIAQQFPPRRAGNRMYAPKGGPVGTTEPYPQTDSASCSIPIFLRKATNSIVPTARREGSPRAGLVRSSWLIPSDKSLGYSQIVPSGLVCSWHRVLNGARVPQSSRSAGVKETEILRKKTARPCIVPELR